MSAAARARSIACWSSGWATANPITAIDTNPFLLQEAAALAKADGLDGLIRFAPGNAEALPFADASFDCIFSVTVLEECDADRALAEMVRVARPGGRVGVIVRSIDLPQWWSVDVPEALRQRALTPPQSVGATGVADASLYRRARQAGLRDLTCFPRPGDPGPARGADLALPRGSPDGTAVAVGSGRLAGRARPCCRAGSPFHGPSHALRRGTQAGRLR